MTRREKKRNFSQWLSQLFSQPSGPSTRRPILVEPLESRQLLAADGFVGILGSSYASNGMDIATSSASTLVGEGELAPEGEDAIDLVAFAQALTDSGTRFFGAAWCTFCTEQKELFQDGYKYLPFIEVTNPDRTPNQVGIDEGITEYPTWEFPDSTRLTGVQTLETLAARAGVSLPMSSTPSFDELPDVNVELGSPLHVPVDAYDPNGNPLTISVTSSDPELISAEVLSGNRSLVLSTAGYGDMVFELFEGRAPVPSGRVIELANDGFYDGVSFHRVINNFVIQGGDPTGTGAGGSTLGDFDDQFNVELQHNRTGVLSYAKSSDDTNDSQFFITEGQQRFLDFNHSVFGQIVEGEPVREAISNTDTNSSDRPTTDVIIESASIINDTENGVLLLKALGTGSATITVTVTDTEGNSTAQTFEATTIQDTANGAPFLNPIPDVETDVNTSVVVNLTSQDAEGDTVIYSVAPLGSDTYGLTVDSSTGQVTVTPPTDFTGQLTFRATVRQTTTPTTSSTDDNQVVVVNVNSSLSAPTSIDLATASDSGTSSTDNLTNLTSLTLSVAGTTTGSTVEIRSGGTVVGSAIASGSTTDVTVDVSALGQGSVLFTASQTLNSQTSTDSPAFTVVLDRAGPTEIASGVVPSSTIVDQPLSLDINQSEEGQGLIYSLTASPAGMSIGASDGVLSWTPTTGQIGAQSVTLTLTDAAGNTTDQQLTITVIEEPQIRILLNAVDSLGQPITTVAAGETFKVQVTLEDLRTNNTGTGVFAAYVDLLYDSAIIEPIAVNPIDFIDPYVNDSKGSTTTPGLIDELGAFSSSTARLGNDLRVLAEVTFLAKAAGNAGLVLESADDIGNDILLYDETTAVPSSKVQYGSSTFAVGANFELVDDSFNFDEDSGAQTLDLLTNDTVSGGAVLTIVDVTSATGGGQLSIASDGLSVSYTSAANFNGAETFVYTAANQEGVELTATVTVQVTDINDPPVALNDTFEVFQNSTVNVLEVLSNDNSGVDDSNSETLTVTAVSSGTAGGVITVGSSGLTINYTPTTGFQGTDTFTYTLSDGRGGTATGTVSVSLGVENPPPTPQNDNFTLSEDFPQATYDVLINDTTDDTTETLSVSAVGESLIGSSVSVSSDGLTILYQPPADFNGTEILSYTLRDSGGATANGLVTFTVTPVNDAPVAVDDTLTALSSSSTTSLTVLANDTDVDQGDTLEITAVTQPSTGNGSVAISSDGTTITYTPPSSSFVGDVSFTYTITDDGGLTDTATVNLNVQDYVLRTIGGSLFYATSETSLSNVQLSLSGTDVNGQTVSLTTVVDSNGDYSFPDRAPGEYVITRAALPFIQDSAASVQISSSVTEGDEVVNMEVSGSLQPQYFDIRDFLGSTTANNLTVAVSADGTANWTTATGEWAELSSLVVSVDTTTDSLIINGVNSSQQNVTATLPISTGTSHVYVAGQESTHRLLRVRGTTSQVGLRVTSAAAGEGELVAEGEASGGVTGLVGEGEFSDHTDSTSILATSSMNSSTTALSVSQVLQSVLGSATRSESSPALSAASVDAAMSAVLPALELQLSPQLQHILASDSDEFSDATDTIIASL